MRKNGKISVISSHLAIIVEETMGSHYKAANYKNTHDVIFGFELHWLHCQAMISIHETKINLKKSKICKKNATKMKSRGTHREA